MNDSDETQRALYVGLRRAEAAFRLRTSDDGARAALIASAVDLLVAGVDSPNLRVLAGADGAHTNELTHYLDDTLVDLGLVPMDDRRVLLTTLEAIALDLVDGRLNAADAARMLWNTWYPRGAEIDLGPAAESLAYTADAFDHVGFEPEQATAEELVAAASAFLVSRKLM